jgi:hypothetical protein
MADEAVLIYELAPPIPFIVADGAGIEKGTVCKMADPMTASASSADNDIFGGIAAEEKVANDGKTKLALYRRGIFKMKIAGGQTATIGKMVVIKGANTIGDYTTLDAEVGYVVGRALETGAAGETVLVEVGAGA